MPTPRILAALAGATCLALAGCVEIARYLNVTIADRVPGLPDRALNLPIRAWISEREVTAEAMAACFDPDCHPRMAMGVFRATGRAAREIEAILDRPDRLRREIGPIPRSPPSSTPAPVAVEIENLSGGGLRGFTVALQQRDGRANAVGVVLAGPQRDPLRFLFAIGADRHVIEAARQTARLEWP